MEKELLRGYVMRFLDKPPLNLSANWREVMRFPQGNWQLCPLGPVWVIFVFQTTKIMVVLAFFFESLPWSIGVAEFEPLESARSFVWWRWFISSGGWFFFAFVFLVTIAYLEGYLQPQKTPQKVSSMPRETRKALAELWWFIGRLATQIVCAAIISLIVTALMFGSHPDISSSFLTGLLTLDSLLIAVVIFMTPYVKDASDFAGFMKHAMDKMHQAARNPDDPTKSYEYSLYSQLASRSLILIVFLPVLALTPFFLSAILVLVALLSAEYRWILAFISVWFTLWCFLAITLAIWKLMMFERKTMKKGQKRR